MGSTPTLGTISKVCFGPLRSAIAVISLKSLLYKLALLVPKVRRWHQTLRFEERLFGAPPTREKLMAITTGRIYGYFAATLTEKIAFLYRKEPWARIRTAGVRARLRKEKPVTIRRKFIITLTQLPQSVKAANRCLEHARQHGMDDGMEIWPATDKFQATDFFRSHQLTWRHTQENFALGKDPLPEMGCFASHYLLWERCVEINEPIIVLEHDSIPVAPLPSLKFRHVILLSKPTYIYGPCRFNEIDYRTPREVFYPMSRLPGAHCYAITPQGAKRMIAAAQGTLVEPVDAFINKKYVDILYYHPFLIDYDHKFSTIDKRPGECLSPEETWADYKRY